MKVAIIGASGFIGSAIRHEALARGHAVTALVMHPEKLTAEPNLTPVKIDVLGLAALVKRLRGHDAAISAFSGHAQKDILGYYLRGIRSIVASVKKAKVPRLLVVGGAGSLNVAPGQQLVDTPQFPEQWKPTAEGARQALALLRKEPTLDWTMLSPSISIAPGTRTGKFRTGADDVLLGEDGESRISLEDYALAMIDELEKPAHSRQRFTVGY